MDVIRKNYKKKVIRAETSSKIKTAVFSSSGITTALLHSKLSKDSKGLQVRAINLISSLMSHASMDIQKHKVGKRFVCQLSFIFQALLCFRVYQRQEFTFFFYKIIMIF